jgi:hypothetical protein
MHARRLLVEVCLVVSFSPKTHDNLQPSLVVNQAAMATARARVLRELLEAGVQS